MTFKHEFLTSWIEKADLEVIFYSFHVERACVLLPLASPLMVNFLLCVWFQRCWRERRRFTLACCCRRWSWSNTSIATPSSASAWCSMRRVSSLRILRPPVDAVRHHLQELFDSASSVFRWHRILSHNASAPHTASCHVHKQF